MKDKCKIDWDNIIDHITVKMLNKFPYLPELDVRSAANEGVWQAFLKFDSTQSKNKISYIKIKGYFTAIDLLRRERWLSRPGSDHHGIKTYNEKDGDTVLDYNLIPIKNYSNFNMLWFELTDGLSPLYTKVLYMRYIEKRTIEEMEKILKFHRRLIRQHIFNARKKLCSLQNVNDINIEMYN